MIAVVGSGENPTNRALVASWRAAGCDAALLSARVALETLAPGDVALGRIDVLPTLDGVEPGLFQLLMLERRGVGVLNPAAGLLAVHDKLRTARLLVAAGIPHPQTRWWRDEAARLEVTPPLVVKPRFGSWGSGIHRCRDEEEARRTLDAVARTSWFQRHGALVQELVPGVECDVRVLVAAGRVLGGVARTAAAGEWRTNVSLGGAKARLAPDPSAAGLATQAAHAVRCDLVAVDLLPMPEGGYVVLELNGAADFDDEYVAPGASVYLKVGEALGVPLGSTRTPS
jgi:RimK family alpha-L-glutamate ligase